MTEPAQLTYEERERLAEDYYALNYDVLVDHPFKIDLSRSQLPPGSWIDESKVKFSIPTEVVSAPNIPLRAAQALVKIACSVCPTEELPQCAPAIDWLLGRAGLKISPFPLLRGFTPEPIHQRAGRVILLRRKRESPEPYLWCVVQSGGHRYQIFVPGCPADRSWLETQPLRLTTRHYRSLEFGPGWPYGETEYKQLDWSGQEPTQTTYQSVWNVMQGSAVRIEEPPAD